MRAAAEIMNDATAPVSAATVLAMKRKNVSRSLIVSASA
jgi:hypothetical protein